MWWVLHTGNQHTEKYLGLQIRENHVDEITEMNISSEHVLIKLPTW